MSIQDVFEFDLDVALAAFPAVAATFPEGTKALSVASPLGGAAGAGKQYRISRRMVMPAGVYRIRGFADDAATCWVGTNLLSSRMVLACDMSGSTDGEFYLPTGTYRLDFIVQNLPVGPSPCYVVFALWKDGALFYASTAAGWSMSDGPISDEDLPPAGDPRLLLPVWTLLPNWKTGITERLTWLTDVMDSESGAEQLRSVRRHARRSFEAEFLRQTAYRTRLDVFFSGVGQYEFLLPLWHEQVKMLDGINIDATGVFFSSNSTAMREFRTGDLVLVNAGDPDDYELLQVAEVEPARFGWASPPKRRWPAGTRVFPLREARLLEGPKLTAFTEQVAKAQVRFELSKPDSRAGSWGNVSGDPVFLFRPNRKTPISADYSRKTYLLDNSSGQIEVTDPGDQSSTNMRFGMTLLGREKVHAYRQFIAAARGRAGRFFCATYMADMVAVSDIDGLTPTLEIAPIGYTEYMSRPQPTRTGIAVQFNDETPTIYRTILAAEAIHLKVTSEFVVRVKGQDVPDQSGAGLFSANNSLLKPAGRSWNVAVFDVDANLISHHTYDVYDDEVAGIEMVNALNALRAHVTVVAYTYDEPQTGLTVDLKAALKRCGASQEALDGIQFRSAYLLVGIPGNGAGSGLERYRGGSEGPMVDAEFEYLLRFVDGAPVGLAERPTKPVSELLYLNEALPPLDRSRIARISFLSEARFDQDSFELHHVTNASRAVETSVVVRQFFNTRTELPTA